MTLRFTVLASGSSGNASLVSVDGFRVLLDAGLGPRQLAKRMAAVGASWPEVQAVLLTHTHSDHWNERTLTYLHRLRIPLYCHAGHHGSLLSYSEAFAVLRAENLVRGYETTGELCLAPALRCRAFRVRHDGGVTCGFRFEGPPDLSGRPYSLGYAADLGCWGPEEVEALGDVDLLALEFNHDVALERTSGRSPQLIARVLGDEGHLSNVQAAALLEAVLRASPLGRLKQVVQLHLSRDCNRPALAAAAAREVLDGSAASVDLYTASQHAPSPTFHLDRPAEAAPAVPRNRRRKAARSGGAPQPWLPGLEWE
jgi:phosphoribosyl 1,2-cyclic phosphodiesterase